MFSFEYDIRVRYGETDQMGYVYYGQYASYYETARVESMRHLGISYKQMEENGVILPVRENHSYFIKPAHYDELLTIKTMVMEMPGVRIKFEYEITNEVKEIIHRGDTELVFINKTTGAPQRPTQEIMDAFKPFFEK